MAIIKKSAPWMTYYREVDALFKKDEEVVVVFDEENLVLKLYVDNQTKAEALGVLMPTEKVFGNVKLTINVIPPNIKSAKINNIDTLSIASDAFVNNEAVYMVRTVSGILNIVYVIFRKEVVQFFDDNIGDINGNYSTLYETIARDVFNDVGIRYCTDNGIKSITTRSATIGGSDVKTCYM